MALFCMCVIVLFPALLLSTAKAFTIFISLVVIGPTTLQIKVKFKIPVSENFQVS